MRRCDRLPSGLFEKLWLRKDKTVESATGFLPIEQAIGGAWLRSSPASDLPSWQSGICSSIRAVVAMGPCVRRDDEGPGSRSLSSCFRRDDWLKDDEHPS